MTQSEFLFSDPTPAIPKQAPSSPKPAKKKPPKVYSVTQLSRLIKIILDEHLPHTILLEGEISNFKHHSSGHLYCTLKDADAQIPAVMWKNASARLKFRPTDGMAVIATGRVKVYEPHGKYQFYIDHLEPAGLGALELAFRQLAEKLRKEGLFDPARKKTLPPIPQTIAIVTATGSAALEDIRNTLSRRFGLVRKLFYPVPVQGENAASPIAAAINDLNRRQQTFGGIDLIILARGGGSIEDLWAFNEEILARAIDRSVIPIITGIGHEVDITIADMVADQRAATPTAAAELAVPVRDELLQGLNQTQQRLSVAITRLGEQVRQKLNALASRPLFSRPTDAIGFRRQCLDEQQAILTQTMTQTLRNTEKKLDARLTVLRQIEPHHALSRAHGQLTQHTTQLQSVLQDFLKQSQNMLSQRTIAFHSLSPQRRIQPASLKLQYLSDRFHLSQKQSFQQRRQQLDHLGTHLENLNPRNVLQRGYSITTHKKTGKILTEKDRLKTGDIIITELAGKHRLESTVSHLHQSEESHDQQRQ